VVAVSLATATAAACGADVVVSEPVPGGSPGTTTMVTGGNNQGGGFVSAGGSAAAPAGGSTCNSPDLEYTFTVTVPPEGVPATAGEICNVTMGPVESNNAARVTLLIDPQNPQLAAGQVAIEPTLLPDVVGLPTIEVVSSPYPELMQMVVQNVAATSSGFAFDASWPSPLPSQPDENAMMILRTTFELMCPPNKTPQVQAHTHVNLCGSGDSLNWVSSGDECTICGIIAEMAPSPIVPDRAADDIGLGKVIRLRLVIVGKIGDSFVLWAEHDGGANLEYEWVASAGEVMAIGPDLVLWTPPPGDHVLQVAVMNDDAAAVASYSSLPLRDAGLVA
jgi:hypothetical protein